MSDDAPRPTEEPKVEVEPSPPTSPSEPTEPVAKSEAKPEPLRIQFALLLGERIVYVVVATMLGVGLYVNLWVAYWHANPSILPRFTADAEFLLAAGAVLLIAFEFRKERLDIGRRADEEAHRRESARVGPP